MTINFLDDKKKRPNGAKNLLDDLLAVLKEETDLHASLLTELEKEKDAIINASVKELDESRSTKENIIFKIKETGERRSHLQKRIAVSRGNADGNFTLTKLCQMIEEPYASGLRKSRSNFSELIEKVRKANRINRVLLTNSLDIVKGSLELLYNMSFSNQVYQKSGKIMTNDRGGRVLSGKI